MAPVMGKMIERRACHWRRKGGRWAAVSGGGTPRPIFAQGIGRPRVSITEKKILETLAGARAPLHSE
jgi:hypothetical protein